ncbi:MAG TPA: hypothetical protein VH598_14320 [Verrucomicrobiae bacterium]|nr:hypothetical protein [Verrucomicrobiae bacterium]
MNFKTLFRNGCPLLLLLAGAVSAPLFQARADVLELTNGDHYTGTIISVTRTNVEFKSEIQGLLKLPRDKVAVMTLHNSSVPKPGAAISQPAPPAPTLIQTNTPSPVTGQGNAMLEQMRRQGVDPKIVSQVQEQILGKSSPEATQKFNELLSGYMTGKISVDDIRSQARNAVQDIQNAKKELGAGEAGEMLDGYLAILQQFLRESDPPTSSPASVSPPK